MKQKAPHYLIVGDGRCATHFRHYFTLLDIPFETWCRKQPRALLDESAARATHILLLISDKAIEEVALSLAALAPQALRVHFSGALVTEAAIGAHPLMTFAPSLYDLDKYRAIPFVLDDGALPFEQILPLVPNAHARLPKERKAFYHALCALAGNFSCLLWQRFFEGIEKDLGLDPELGKPYCRQQNENILLDYANALTGPLKRGDTATIQKNLDALGDDAFADVYRAFVAAYHKKQE